MCLRSRRHLKISGISGLQFTIKILTFRDEVAIVNVIGGRCMWETWKYCQVEIQKLCRKAQTHGSYRVPPECFTHDSLHIWQCWSIIEVGESILANDFVNFCLCFGLYFWVEDHSKKEYK